MATSALGETRSERKRNLILISARAIFTREGFASTGMEQVARDAGVSTATLYAYFPGKADLFRVVIEHNLADIADRVKASQAAAGDAGTRLKAFGMAYAEFYCSPLSRAIFRMVIAERRRFPDLAEHLQTRGRTELGGVAMAIVRDLADAGQIVIDKPSWAAGQLQGMIEHATLILGLVAGDEVMPTRSIEALVSDAVATFLARYGVKEIAA